MCDGTVVDAILCNIVVEEDGHTIVREVGVATLKAYKQSSVFILILCLI